MKRNLLTLIILMILIVNTVLTAIMMINVSNASKRTATLVDSISTMLAMDTSGGGASGAVKTDVSIDDTALHNIENQLTIPLALGPDGSPHYCVTGVTLRMNIQSDGYASYGAVVADYETLITSAVEGVIRGYTLEEAQSGTSMMQEDCLAAVQGVFNSDFIYQVEFPGMLFQ